MLKKLIPCLWNISKISKRGMLSALYGGAKDTLDKINPKKVILFRLGDTLGDINKKYPLIAQIDNQSRIITSSAESEFSRGVLQESAMEHYTRQWESIKPENREDSFGITQQDVDFWDDLFKKEEVNQYNAFLYNVSKVNLDPKDLTLENLGKIPAFTKEWDPDERIVHLGDKKVQEYIDAYKRGMNQDKMDSLSEYHYLKRDLEELGDPTQATEEYLSRFYTFRKLEEVFGGSFSLKKLANLFDYSYKPEIRNGFDTMIRIAEGFAESIQDLPGGMALYKQMINNIQDYKSNIEKQLNRFELGEYDIPDKEKNGWAKEMISWSLGKMGASEAQVYTYNKFMQSGHSLFKTLYEGHGLALLKRFGGDEYDNWINTYLNTLGNPKELFTAIPLLDGTYEMPASHKALSMMNSKGWVIASSVLIPLGGVQMLLMQTLNTAGIVKTGKLDQKTHDLMGDFMEKYGFLTTPGETNKSFSSVGGMIKYMESLDQAQRKAMLDELLTTGSYNAWEILMRSTIKKEALADILGITDEASMKSFEQSFIRIGELGGIEAQQAFMNRVMNDFKESFQHMTGLDLDHRDSRVLTTSLGRKIWNKSFGVLGSRGANAFNTNVHMMRTLMGEFVDRATGTTNHGRRTTQEVEVEMWGPDDPTEKQNVHFEFFMHNQDYTRYMERVFGILQLAFLAEQAKDDTNILNAWDFFELFNGQSGALRRGTGPGRAMELAFRTMFYREPDVDTAVLAGMNFVQSIMNNVRKNFTPFAIGADVADSMIFNDGETFWQAFRAAVHREAGGMARSLTSVIRTPKGVDVQLPMDNTSFVSAFNPFADERKQEIYGFKQGYKNEQLLGAMLSGEFWAKDGEVMLGQLRWNLKNSIPIYRNISLKGIDNSEGQAFSKAIYQMQLPQYDGMVYGDSLGSGIQTVEGLEAAYNTMIESRPWDSTQYNGLRKEIGKNDRLNSEEKYFINQLLDDMEGGTLILEDVSNAKLAQTKHLVILNALADNANPGSGTYIISELLFQEWSNKVNSIFKETGIRQIEGKFPSYRNKVDHIKEYYPSVYEQELRETVDKYGKFLNKVNLPKYGFIAAREVVSNVEGGDVLLAGSNQEIIKTPFMEHFMLDTFVRQALARGETDPMAYSTAYSKLLTSSYFDVNDPEKNAGLLDFRVKTAAHYAQIIDDSNIPLESKVSAKTGLLFPLLQWGMDQLRNPEVSKALGEDTIENFKTLAFGNFAGLKELDSYKDKETLEGGAPTPKIKSGSYTFNNYNTSKGSYNYYAPKINYKNYQMVRDEYYNFINRSLPFFYTKNIFLPKNIGWEHRMDLGKMTYLKYRNLPQGVNNPISVLVKGPSGYVKEKKGRAFKLRKGSIGLTKLPKPKSKGSN